MLLLKFIGGMLSKLLSKLFSFATFSFLGRVPSKDDSKISFIGVLSFYWLLLCFSLAYPQALSHIILFAPKDPAAVRVITLFLLVLVPLMTGWTTTKVSNYDSEKRPLWKQLLYGYPYTVILGFLVVGLIITVPLVKARAFLLLYYLDTIKIMIHKGNYDEAIKEIRSILKNHSIESHGVNPNKILWLQFIALIWVEGEIFHHRMSKEMKVIKGKHDGKDFQILLHATDIAITGKREIATKLRAILAENLSEKNMYFSWDEKGHKIEDTIQDYKKKLENGESIEGKSIAELVENLRDIGLSQEEWSAIRKQIYKLEVLNGGEGGSVE
ncbi:hypothetical protein LRR81_11835 [Metabacillus sp. GX 13764]|uniref:hypothetical protein n=1 Tax=Metabacillus kandeliae TaxID=2900151 RepID=UPI001E42B4AF|nr:hypothetical protein [Metabacillus kandeliae]MCD7034938.1 hypothetical protein [Metabacillus kandeliae]